MVEHGGLKGKICLNMIVKNETPVLDRLFRSVVKYIDYWVIVDTGSTDGTQQFIRDWFDKAGVPGELHEQPWVNFGHNRQQALELAVDANKTDWLLFIDADEEWVVTQPQVFDTLQPGTSYRIEKKHSDISYFLSALVDISQSSWGWQAPVHEYLQQLSGPSSSEILAGVYIQYHEGEGARSTSVTAEEKFLGDARILEKHLKKHPGDARSHFYLANSYKDAGHHDKAFAAYRKRCSIEGWAEEDFMARLQMGRVAIWLNKPEEEVLEFLLAAFDFRPSRAEPLHELARYYRTREQYAKAFIFAYSGSRIERPGDTLFVSEAVYSWQMLDELGVSGYWVGAYQVSLQACQTLLDRVAQGLQLAESDLERVRQNLQYSQDKVKIS